MSWPGTLATLPESCRGRHRRTELVVRSDPSRNRSAAARRKRCSPGITLNGIRQQAIRKDTVPLVVTQHIQFPVLTPATRRVC